MALQPVGQTSRFIVRCEDSANPAAFKLGQAVLASCELDLSLLGNYLPFSGPNGDDFTRHPVIVEVTPTGPQAGGANNTGSHIAQSSFIRIHPFSPAGPPITDEFARFLFIAEMSEILMGFYGWDLSTSQGEALSRILAEQFYPNAAYDTSSSVSPAPWVNEWLNDFTPAKPGSAAVPRPDWVATNKPTDLDQISYGCGILFINYLRSQRGFSLRDICGAGGVTLLDRYHNLTAQGDDGLARMVALIDSHYLTSAQIKLLNNNPFPLLDGADRIVTLGFERPKATSHPLPLTGMAHVSPFFLCPAKNYRYWEVTRTAPWKITATATGFGQPNFQWKVNGTPLSLSAGQLQVSASFTIPNPNNPTHPTPSNGPFDFSYETANNFTREALTNNLLLTNLSFGGSYDLELSVEVSESVGAADPAIAKQSITFETRAIVYEAQYYIDQAACEKTFTGMLSHVPKLQAQIDIIRTLPDPPPPGAIRQVLEAVEAIRQELTRIANTDRALASNAARYVAQKLNVPEQLIFAPHLRTDTL